jgi:hypothetical protein
MRGQRTLFTNIFIDNKPLVAEKAAKGRNNKLYVRRNDLLLHRYYYLGNTTGYRFDLIIQQLRDEFFITERTITEVISMNSGSLMAIKNKPPTKLQIKQKYPHINWE